MNGNTRFFFLIFYLFSLPPLFAESSPEKPTSSLMKLMEGNQRYTKGKSIHPPLNIRRKELLSSQAPFAIILETVNRFIFVEFLDYFGRFSTSNLGGYIQLSILPPTI